MTSNVDSAVSDTTSVNQTPSPSDIGPKYHSEEQGKVVNGVLTRKEPYPIASLCGEYHWVWNGDGEEPSLLRPEDTDEWGCINFQRKKGKRAFKAENIEGKIQMCSLNGSFDSMKESEVEQKGVAEDQGGSEDAEGDDQETGGDDGGSGKGAKKPGKAQMKQHNEKKVIANSWKVSVKGATPEDEDYFGGKENIVALSEVVDDRGLPFLVYTVPPKGGRHGESGAQMIAKKIHGKKQTKAKGRARGKVKDKKAAESQTDVENHEAEQGRKSDVEWEPLTDAEQKRLGIQLAPEKSAKSGTESTEDTGEVAENGEASAEQELEGDEGGVKEQLPTGVKRKASEPLEDLIQSKAPKLDDESGGEDEEVIAEEEKMVTQDEVNELMADGTEEGQEVPQEGADSTIEADDEKEYKPE